MTSDSPIQPMISMAGAQVKCNECGAAVYWKPAEMGLACDHCGAVREVKRLPGQILERTLLEGRRMEESDPEAVLGISTKSLRCDTCGARVTLLDRDTSEHCSFCGSPHVLPDEELRSPIRPESLIPLMMPMENVAATFADWLDSRWFRPNALKRLDVFEASGLYVPAWTFDAEASSSWTAQAGYYYYVTQTYTTRVNGKMVTRTRQVRKVRWEPASGYREDVYDDLQIMASAGLDRELARKLGEFDTTELVPYQPEYLVGWEAEEYALDLAGGWAQGERRMQEIQEDLCSGDVPGDTQRNLRVQTQLEGVRWKHILLPIWSLAYEYRGKPYAVLINGQSGKIVGRAPYSWVKILGAVLLVAIVVTLIAGFYQGR